jgi:outer membrane protein TolC
VRTAILLLAASLGALPAAAAELTLAEAIERAARENPSLRAARERSAAAASQSRATARLANWPRLELSGAWTGTDSAAAVFGQKLDAGRISARDFELDRLNDPSPRAHLSTALALELPLDAFAKAVPVRRGADAQSRAAQEIAREEELGVRLRVAEAWHHALVAGRAVAATEKTLAGAASREAEIDAQAAEGAALRADLLRARARRRALEADLATRRGAEHSALAELALAVGTQEPVAPAPCDAAMTGAGAVGCAPPDDPGDLAGWLEGGERRPSVAAAVARRESAAEGARGAERESRPDLMLMARLQDDRGPLPEGRASGIAGLFLRWGLYDPQRAARREAARSASAAAEADATLARDVARFEIETAWHRARSSRERWLASSGGTEEGQEALRVVRERRAAGLATLTDELETEAAALAAELDELAAAADASIARAALERTAGASPLESPK